MLQTETVGTFNEIASRLPRLDGKRIALSTLWRWSTKGCRGVRLEARRLGGRYITSIEAVDRFSARLAELDALPSEPKPRAEKQVPISRTPAQRQRAIEAAEARLAAAGV
jgi:hypothetical protein